MPKDNFVHVEGKAWKSYGTVYHGYTGAKNAPIKEPASFDGFWIVIFIFIGIPMCLGWGYLMPLAERIFWLIMKELGA